MTQWTHAEKRTFLRQRVEARLASLLMESKEYSEALSLLLGLITEVRSLDDKLLLVDIDLLESQGGKNLVLSSAAKKWKDFKSTLTRHYILPYIKERETLSQPPELYKFIEKAEWDAFVASRLSQEFVSDQLEETMLGVEIDRSTLWKKARQDKDGNIPDPKVAEKAKLIDELQKQVAEGSLSVSCNNDVLTLALGPEHLGRVRGVGAGISPRQYFNLP
ncbi:unnamed protein product [Prunus armeniaca]